MNYQELQIKRDYYQKNKKKISEITLKSYERAFEVEYTHNSTAIEGNTLTLIETKLLLEDKISIGGKNLREIYEQVNHDKAYTYVKDCVEKEIPLGEKEVKDIHAILMEGIFIGGIYRDVDVYISGAEHTPPSPNEMYKQIKNFYSDLSWKDKDKELNPIEMAAWTHAEFVRIHPFSDGNGRTARLIMNYQLMLTGFAPISIKKENRIDYFNTLEEYAINGSIEPFAQMIAELEEVQLDKYMDMIKNNPSCENKE